MKKSIILALVLLCLPLAVKAEGPAEFLRDLNTFRRAYGRPALTWDSTLAWYAARNTAIHSPQSRAPGSTQCWASSRSYLQSLQMWKASPPHCAILLNARSLVGVSPCYSGMTLNAR